MRTSILAIAVLVLIVIVGLVWFIADANPPSSTEENSTYTSAAYRISFLYPDRYFVVEQNIGTPQRGRYVIVLVEDTIENRELFSGTATSSGGREFPPTISIDIFQNNLDHYAAEDWVRGTNDSNFKLSPDGLLASTTVDTLEGLRYRWSGLYEGESVVVARPAYLYMFSVSYLAPADQIRSDFQDILNTTAIE